VYPMKNDHLSASAQKVQASLTALGLDCHVVELPGSTRTAEEAAQAIGCAAGQIVKSLVLVGKKSKRTFLVLASGPNRVDLAAIGVHVGEKVKMASAERVRQQTGFAVGGVPPLGHANPLPAYIDRCLIGYAEIWAAAGTPHAVFRLTPADLVRMTNGEVIDIVG
jgi:prolyl-tRNA editing enzyme YbaK/EbsC (Cys-tRNA(Pro) deacylase)